MSPYNRIKIGEMVLKSTARVKIGNYGHFRSWRMYDSLNKFCEQSNEFKYVFIRVSKLKTMTLYYKIIKI